MAKKRKRSGIIEYTVAERYFVTLRKTNGSCAFTLKDDDSGRRITGGQPGTCAKARKHVNQIIRLLKARE